MWFESFRHERANDPLFCLCQIEVRDRREPRYGVQRLHWGRLQRREKIKKTSLLLLSFPPSLSSSSLQWSGYRPSQCRHTKCTGFCKIISRKTNNTRNYILKGGVGKGFFKVVHLRLDFLNKYLYDNKENLLYWKSLDLCENFHTLQWRTIKPVYDFYHDSFQNLCCVETLTWFRSVASMASERVCSAWW